MPDPVKSSVVVTTLPAFQDIGGLKANSSFTVDSTTDCWTVHVLLPLAMIPVMQSLGMTMNLRVMRSDDPNYKVTNSAPWLAQAPIVVGLDKKINGYAACRFPNAQVEESRVAGAWTAQLMAVSSQTAFGIDLSTIQIWLSERRIQNAPAPAPNVVNGFVLPIRFVLVTPRAQISAASDLLSQAINVFTSIYGAVRLKATQTLPLETVTSEKSFVANMREGDLAPLIAQYASPTCITVFSIVTFTIDAPGASGLSMIPGPQGFVCSDSAVLAVLKVQSQMETVASVGRRLAHEVGHYLGLVHESACLDSPATAGDIALCTSALDNRNLPTARPLLNNLMYKTNPGSNLNPAQQYQLMRAPFVERTVTILRTKVTKLRVKVHTGYGIRDFHDLVLGDSAGTDDNVFFRLRSPNGASLTENEVSSFWNDFEQGDDMWYQLGVPDSLCEEDIAGFSLSKSFNPDKIHFFGSDHWLLQGLVIEINDRVWYSNDNIHTWLANDGSAIPTFNGPLARPSTLAATRTPPNPHRGDGFRTNEALWAGDHGKAILTDAPVPAFATPPFSRYPVALAFDRASNCYAQTSAHWASMLPTCTQMSLQAWINFADSQGEQVILSAADSQNRVFLRLKDGAYEVGCTLNGIETVASISIPAGDQNRWIHLCGAYNGSTWAIHRNGDAMVTSAPCSLPAASDVPLTVGAYDSAHGFFNGRMRNVCFWKADRTALQELGDLFWIDPADPNVVAYWPLGEADGFLCYDSTAQAYDLTVSGASWVLPVSTRPNAFFLPASPQAAPVFVSVTAPKLTSSFTTMGMTVCGWFKAGDATDTNWERTLVAAGNFVLRIKNGFYECGQAATPAALLSCRIPTGDVGHWVHLAVQYDVAAQRWRLIRNGHTLAELASGQGFAAPASGVAWTFGGVTGSPSVPNPLLMRNVCVFSSTVPLAKLRSAYVLLDPEAMPSPSTDGLVAFWPFTEGAGSTAYDYTVSNDDPTAANVTFDPRTAGWGISPPLPICLFVDSGHSIQTSLAQVVSASAQKPYCVMLAPATFSEQVVLPQYVSMVGAGASLTELTNAPLKSQPGTLQLTGTQELRQLTVSSAGPGTWGSNFIAVRIDSGDNILLEHVTVRATQSLGQGYNVQPLSVNAFSGSCKSVVLLNCSLTADPGAFFYVISASACRLNLQGCTVSGAQVGLIIEAFESSDVTTLTNCTVQSDMALRADDYASIVAKACQISGSTQGNVSVIS